MICYNERLNWKLERGLRQEPERLGMMRLDKLLPLDLTRRAGERYRLTFQKLVRFFAAHLCRDPETWLVKPLFAHTSYCRRPGAYPV
jgi:hypothetical protein